MADTIDIRTLKETNLKKYSLKQTIDVIEALEKIVIEQSSTSFVDQTDDIIDLEVFEDYYSKSTLIRNRIVFDDFNDIPKRNWGIQKENLLSRLLNIMITFQRIRDSILISFAVSRNVRELNHLEDSYDLLLKDYSQKKAQIEQNVNDSIGEIDKKLETIQNTENKTVSHVLSLMGIFTAVITIILSVVVTSSSWLNNASDASAIVAFVIPNMVTLLAVISLMLLVFIYNRILYPPITKGKNKSYIAVVISAFLLIVILSIAFFVGHITNQQSKSIDSIPHTRYVLTDNQYVVVKKTDAHSNEEKKYIEIVWEGKNLQFSYDESLFHDSKLYYCPVHNELE